VSDTAYLALENGRVFEGRFFGDKRDTLGELVFTTTMAGYLETITDSNYYGQIVLQTFPLIGNYGVIPADYESSSAKINGYIVNSWCEAPSNFRSEGDLDTFLKAERIPGIYGLDTREIAKIIRENGVMNAKITADKNSIDFDEIKNYKIVNAVKNVSCNMVSHTPSEKGTYRVILIDFGMKESLKQKLLDKNCDVFTVPHDWPVSEIKLCANLGGIVLSGGPGDPADNPEIIANLKEIIKLNVPVFGIGLGHQLLALAYGFKTRKLKYGHRGANQPVKESTSRVYITSQNHGYEVIRESIDPSIANVSFENVNDKSCEGIEYINSPVFSAQFYPDECDSPHGTGFLLNKFIKNIERGKSDAVR